jgi:hypothetical protein
VWENPVDLETETADVLIIPAGLEAEMAYPGCTKHIEGNRCLRGERIGSYDHADTVIPPLGIHDFTRA